MNGALSCVDSIDVMLSWVFVIVIIRKVTCVIDKKIMMNSHVA